MQDLIGNYIAVQEILSRPRRNRRSSSIRGAISETYVSPANLILPVFIHDGEKNIPISSMPGVDRLGWRHGLLSSVAEARSYGVNSVVLFPKVLSLLLLEMSIGPDFTLSWLLTAFACVLSQPTHSCASHNVLKSRLRHADPGRSEDANGRGGIQP